MIRNTSYAKGTSGKKNLFSAFGKCCFWSIWLVFLFFSGVTVESTTQPQFNKTQSGKEIVEQYLPLPENTTREIQNPYYATPVWKLWAQDSSPVTIDKPPFKGKYRTPSIADRKVPVFDVKPGSTFVFQSKKDFPLAGLFDDVYLSLDNGHTGLGYPPSNLFINAGKMATAHDYKTRFQLGVNFTSQSYARRGRAIVDDTMNNLNTENYFFFANCVRATPGYDSFKDTQEDSATDFYDGLHAHSFHSLGQSGSEVHALSKMMIAGASMPRTTKDLLKKHGAYSIALLTLFKAALPYADASGVPLPYEHELRHRPVYSSNGNPKHKHFCSANIFFHGYDENRHLWDMARLARAMKIAPPVAILGIADIQIKSQEKQLTDKAEIVKRIKSSSLTAIRIWGEQDETLEVLVDLRKSYDLQGQELSYSCQRLYPNQKNARVEEIESGVFAVSATYDPNLPKGRISIICAARNLGEIPSNPVFINFYWPGENELSDYGLSRGADKKNKDQGLKKLPVMVNKRPEVQMNFIGDSIACKPGDTIAVDFKMVDPEGFPVTIFRRLDQWGTVENGKYIVHIPRSARPHVEPIHFIFSDGTGGYNSKQIKLCIGKSDALLADSWATSLLGKTSLRGKVIQEGDTFLFRGMAVEEEVKKPQGLFAFQMVSGAIDIVAQIPAKNYYSDIGLLLTNSLDNFSRQAYVGFFQGKIQAHMRQREQRWGSSENTLQKSWGVKPKLFRIVRREDYTAVFVSQDNQNWLQLSEAKINWFQTIYAGFLYGGGRREVECLWKKPSEELTLIHPIKSKKDKAGNFILPLRLKVSLPEGYTGRYSFDVETPGFELPVIEKEIEIITEGEHQIKVILYKNGEPEYTTTAFYSTVTGKSKKSLK